MPISSIKREEIDIAVKHLRAQDIEIEFYNASSKLEEIYMANASQSDLLMASRGGFNSVELLYELDFSRLKKPICGYSDITVLLNAALACTGKVQYLGPTLKSLAFDDTSYSLNNFIRTALKNETKNYIQSEYYVDTHFDKTKNFNDEKPFIVNQGQASGILVGGNLCSQVLLAGSKFFPVFDEMIILAEEDDLCGEYTADIFLRNLYALFNYDFADKIKALVIGRFQKNSKIDTPKFTENLKSFSKLNKIPIIANFDMGHTLPIQTLPLGKRGVLNAEEKIIFEF